jgi:hypothetical protein
VYERDPGTLIDIGFFVFPDQSGFRHPNARQVRHDTEMAGEAETPGVRVTLAVAEQKIGANMQALEGVQYGRYLPERKQARNIRKARGTLGYCLIEKLQRGKAKYGDCRSGSAARIFEADVDPGNRTDCPEIVGLYHQAAKTVLDRARLAWRHVPGVAD